MQIIPHGGGVLVDRILEESDRKEALVQIASLPVIVMNSREAADFDMLANGSFSPLTGFMTEKNYTSCLNDMKLADGTLWPLPVTLAVTSEQAQELKPGLLCSLKSDTDAEILGDILVEDIYTYDKTAECQAAFGTTDANHPGVAKVLDQKPVYVGGQIRAYGQSAYADKFPEYASPKDVRTAIEQSGWETIAAFQTRNPIHRAHEYLTKVALEICDGILIHPIVGALKEGDIPAEVRLDCYRELLDKYYPKDRVLLKVYPMEMRYAGPKEAILHAIIRQNFGCTHLIVGRDHAGVGNYYGPFDAQRIFYTLPSGALAIDILRFDWTFWCNECGGIASTKTCPHDASHHFKVSGTELRRMLSEGKHPPVEITRPEVADILIKYYQTIASKE